MSELYSQMDRARLNEVAVQMAEELAALREKMPVRCGECVFAQKGDQIDPDRLACINGIVEPDDFCSRGVRKEK